MVGMVPPPFGNPILFGPLGQKVGACIFLASLL